MSNPYAAALRSGYLPTFSAHRLMLAVTIFGAALDAVWCLCGEWSFEVREIYPSLIAVATMLVPLFLYRYRNDPKIRTLCESAALLICFSIVAGVLSYLVVSTNAPLVDHTLDSWDRRLGFDWPTFYLWVDHHSRLHRAFAIAYASALPQMAFVLVFLSFTTRIEQLADFTCSLAVSFILTVVVSGIFPAGEASELYFSAVPTDISTHTDFAAVREGTLRTLHLLHMQGMISMPSFHTVLAILLAYAMRRTALFAVFVAINLLVIASTPTEGGHYLVDVLGGVATAALSIYVIKLPSFSRLFRPYSNPTA